MIKFDAQLLALRRLKAVNNSISRLNDSEWLEAFAFTKTGHIARHFHIADTTAKTGNLHSLCFVW